jgi:hypothetical protein
VHTIVSADAFQMRRPRVPADDEALQLTPPDAED